MGRIQPFCIGSLVCEQVDTSDKENKDQCYQGFACGEKGEVCLRLPAAVWVVKKVCISSHVRKLTPCERTWMRRRRRKR